MLRLLYRLLSLLVLLPGFLQADVWSCWHRQYKSWQEVLLLLLLAILSAVPLVHALHVCSISRRAGVNCHSPKSTRSSHTHIAA